MVIDLFYFFQELDLLEIRLNILDPYVDKFIICEATKTFSGDDKPLYYELNKERYAKWAHKIEHHVVDDFDDPVYLKMAKDSPNTGAGEHYWVREFYIKEMAKEALKGLDDNDIVYISDLDEIWNPELFEQFDIAHDQYIRPIQKNYLYWLNNRNEKDWHGWTGTVATRYKNIKSECLNHIRTHGKTKCIELENGGWHFTYMGGYEGARRKIEEANHPEYIGVLKDLQEKVKNNQDYRGRPTKCWKDEEGLPEYILANKERYKHLLI